MSFMLLNKKLVNDGTQKESPRQPSYTEKPKRYLSILHSAMKRMVPTDELSRYVALYIAIVFSVLAYHFIGVWLFTPPDTKIVTKMDEPGIHYSNSSEYKSVAYWITLINSLPLILPIVILLCLRVFVWAVKYVYNLSKPTDQKRDVVRTIILGVCTVGLIGSLYYLFPYEFSVAFLFAFHFARAFVYGFALNFPFDLVIGYGIFVAFPKIGSKKLKTLVAILAMILFVVVRILVAYFLHYLIGGASIVEHFEKAGGDISEFENFFTEHNVDISRVFIVYNGPFSNNVAVNRLPFKFMTSIFIGWSFLTTRSFDMIKGALLHEMGHAKHFDILYLSVVPTILTVLAVNALAKIIGKPKERSALESFYILCAKVLLFTLIRTLIHNAVSQICEFGADMYACSYTESSGYLSEFLSRMADRKTIFYFPFLSPIYDHPSYFHRMKFNNFIAKGSVELTHPPEGCPREGFTLLSILMGH